MFLLGTQFLRVAGKNVFSIRKIDKSMILYFVLYFSLARNVKHVLCVYGEFFAFCLLLAWSKNTQKPHQKCEIWSKKGGKLQRHDAPI